MDLIILLPIACILLLAYYTYTLQNSYRNLPPVILASHEIFEEVANMEEYSYKIAHEYYTYPRSFGKELGLLFAYSYPLWTEMRRFAVRTLREFGFGKLYTMHSMITEEAQVLMKVLEKNMKEGDGIIRFRTTFSLSVLNVLWCMVAGTRYEHDDPRLVKLMENTFKLSKCSTMGNPYELIVPLIRKVFPAFARMRFNVFDECNEFSKSLVEERKAEGFYLTDPQNYIDVFLKNIHESRDKKDTLYTEEQLIMMLADLLLVGTFTLNATLNYAVLYLLINPKIQERCQKEIDSVIARHMSPTIEDVEKMPYFQAFILEVHRCSIVIPVPIPRIVPKDWNLRGYKIPKGTLILSNHYTVNKDDKIWGDADVFRPERFINEKGEFVPDPRVVIFGYGKRICIGIHLVNSVVPILIATLLQRFNFAIVPGTQPPTTDPDVGINLSPQEFSALVTVRQFPAKASN